MKDVCITAYESSVIGCILQTMFTGALDALSAIHYGRYFCECAHTNPVIKAYALVTFSVYCSTRVCRNEQCGTTSENDKVQLARSGNDRLRIKRSKSPKKSLRRLHRTLSHCLWTTASSSVVSWRTCWGITVCSSSVEFPNVAHFFGNGESYSHIVPSAIKLTSGTMRWFDRRQTTTLFGWALAGLG